jgi:two-component system, LuxR family, response regulator FixJ
VVDDDLAVRQSLSFLLASDGLPVRLHESALAFLDAMTDTSTGCIVTDVRMPGIDGIELLRRLKARGFSLPVIVMTGHADVPMAVEAMKEGAVDFIEKPFDDDMFLAAVRSALRLQEQHAQRDAQITEVQARLQGLSERERQVLEGLVAGKANKVIAYDLGISPRTVEIYRANVMTKMQAGSLSELVRMALVVGGLPTG